MSSWYLLLEVPIQKFRIKESSNVVDTELSHMIFVTRIFMGPWFLTVAGLTYLQILYNIHTPYSLF